MATAKENHGQDLPKAKEVWRWVKTLVQEHIVLKERLHEQTELIQKLDENRRQKQAKRH